MYNESTFLNQHNWQKQLPWAGIAFALHAAAIGALLALSQSGPKPPDVLSVSLLASAPSPLPPAPAPAPQPPKQVVKKQSKPVTAPPVVTTSPTAISTPQQTAASNTTSTSTSATPASSSSAQANEATLVQPRADAAYLNNPKPNYPSAAKRMGEQGTVYLRVYVLADGTVGRIELKKSSGSARLDASAEEAVQRWRFVPGRLGNEAIATWSVVPVSFSLTN